MPLFPGHENLSVGGVVPVSRPGQCLALTLSECQRWRESSTLALRSVEL